MLGRKYSNAISTCCQNATNMSSICHQRAIYLCNRCAANSAICYIFAIENWSCASSHSSRELLIHATVQSICYQYAIYALWILNKFAIELLWMHNRHARKKKCWCAIPMLATRYRSDNDMPLICYATVLCYQRATNTLWAPYATDLLCLVLAVSTCYQYLVNMLSICLSLREYYAVNMLRYRPVSNY